jgi:biopolymer transport protein ExbB
MLLSLLTLLQTAGTNVDPAAAAQQQQQAAKVAEEGIPMLSIMIKGGFVMGLLAVCLLLTIYFIIERFIYINQRSKIDFTMVNVIKDNLKENRFDSAYKLCARTNTAQAQMMATGLNLLGANLREIESAMETRANIELSAMEGNLSYLSLIARIAPMLGFVGTIWGVINIFYTVAQVGGLEIGAIADGLYIKLVTSFAGLLVGIISFFGYQLFMRKIDKFAERLQEQSLQLMELLTKSNH